MCTSVQIRSLSSLPRTLLRLISYSVAGYSLVMVNSVTVLGTTELSSRPTKEEQKSQVKFHGSHINAAHDTGSPSGTLSCSPDRRAQGSASIWERGGLGVLEFEETLHADATPLSYRIPRTKAGKTIY